METRYENIVWSDSHTCYRPLIKIASSIIKKKKRVRTTNMYFTFGITLRVFVVHIHAFILTNNHFSRVSLYASCERANKNCGTSRARTRRREQPKFRAGSSQWRCRCILSYRTATLFLPLQEFLRLLHEWGLFLV